MKIQYQDKVTNGGISAQGRFSSANANEIKESVNTLYDQVDTLASTDYVNDEIANTVDYVNQGDEINANAIEAETNRAEFAESVLSNTKADKTEIVNILQINFSDSGWNVGKTTFTFTTPITASYSVYSNFLGRFLLSGEVTKTSGYFTLNSAATSDDTYFIMGSFGMPANTSNTDVTDKIERMRKRLAGQSNLQVGIVDLSDIGMTQSNPFNLKFWYDGAIVWPLLKIQSNFNNAWREGNIDYIDDSTGDRYASISLFKYRDPTYSNVVVYYQSYATGSDSNAGTLESAPMKRLTATIEKAKTETAVGGTYSGRSAKIICLDSWVGSDSLSTTSIVIPDGIKIKIVGRPPFTGQKTRLVGMREAYTDSLFNFTETSSGSGVWVCQSGSINNATKNTPMCFDVLNRDADGSPKPLKYIAPQADEAATIALIQATPSSFGSYTTAGTPKLYVHLIDGRKPTVSDWVYCEASGQINCTIGEGSYLAFENIERIFTTEGVQLAGLRARPINVPGTYTTHTCEFWTYNCGVYGSSGQGVQMYDMLYGGNEFLTVKYCREDAENWHSFNTFVMNPLMGNYINYWSNMNVAEFLGENYFKNMPAVGNSTQATSAHDRVNYIGINMIGGYTSGCPCAHVSGAQVTHINSHFYFPTQNTGLQPPGSGSPKTAFWADGDGVNTGDYTKINLIGCGGHVLRNVNSKIFCVTNNGIIIYFAHKGVTTSITPFYNGGTLTEIPLNA